MPNTTLIIIPKIRNFKNTVKVLKRYVVIYIIYFRKIYIYCKGANKKPFFKKKNNYRKDAKHYFVNIIFLKKLKNIYLKHRNADIFKKISYCIEAKNKAILHFSFLKKNKRIATFAEFSKVR
jgi:hypothetical protein